MNLADELDLCYDENILSNKYKLLKVLKLIGAEAKTWDEIPNKYWAMADREMEGRKVMRAKQIFKLFPERLLTSSFHITQLLTKIMMSKEQRFNSHSYKI